jgi:hypothetical protein
LQPFSTLTGPLVVGPDVDLFEISVLHHVFLRLKANAERLFEVFKLAACSLLPSDQIKRKINNEKL